MKTCIKKMFVLALAVIMVMSMSLNVFAATDLTGGDETWSWDEETKTLTLNGAALTEEVSLPDGATIVVNGDSSIICTNTNDNAITSTGALTITGTGTLTLSGYNGIKALSVAIENVGVNFVGVSCGINVTTSVGDAAVVLTNVKGSIEGSYAGIYVNGECSEKEAYVTLEGCDLTATSTATSWNNRARKAGITVYVSVAKKVNSTINVIDSRLTATGFDAGLSINNYLNDADATNDASSRINIENSTVAAYSTGGTWAGLFASVLGQHPDADSIITITNSSVYAVSPNTGILTSSQKGESKIILDNSILGASGKTALSMIEPTSQVQAAELNNGSTYVQMTPAAVMNGEIKNFDGKVITAVEGEITYDPTEPYYVIPQNAVVTEAFTDGTVKEYTFTTQAGGIGGFTYAKEEIWGFDAPEIPEEPETPEEPEIPEEPEDPMQNYMLYFDKGTASHICYLYVDRTTGEVIFDHKYDFSSSATSAEIPAKKGYISVIFIKQAQSGIIWTAEEVSDEVMDEIVASVIVKDRSYKGHDAEAYGEGTHDLTYSIGNAKKGKTKTVSYCFLAD